MIYNETAVTVGLCKIRTGIDITIGDFRPRQAHTLSSQRGRRRVFDYGEYGGRPALR